MKLNSNPISRTCFLFLAIFLGGFGLFLLQSNLFLRQTNKLDIQTDNQNNRIRLGEKIGNDIQKVKADFFQLTTSSDTHVQHLLHSTILAHTAGIKQALDIIERGGTMNYTIPLNLPGIHEMETTISYQPIHQEKYIVEIIELRPQALEIEERLQTLMDMLIIRDQYIQNKNSKKLFSTIKKIKIFLKECEPLFSRMKENTNLLFFKSQKQLTKIEETGAVKRKHYFFMETGLALCIILTMVALMRLTSARLAKIVELKQAQKIMAESFWRFSKVLDGMDTVIYVVDPQTMEILFINRYCREKFGDVVGRKCFQVFAEEKNDKICPCCTHFTSLPKNKQKCENIVWEREDNGKFYEIHGQLIDWKDNINALHVLVIDITERKLAAKKEKEMEDRLNRSKKMEAIGLMAGGVAHDLNNILSGITAYPEILLMELPEESEMRLPLEEIQSSGQRAAAVVDDLLTVARGVAKTRTTANLNDLVTAYLGSPEFNKLISLHPQIQVSSKLASDLKHIKCSAIHIQKVLMNLVTNGVEAMDTAGKVIITTSNMYLKQPNRAQTTSQSLPVETGEYVQLRVEDNGPGIATEDLDRIFEPFYTKKVMGRSGTGLGLAVVWNTIQDHQGSITVNSNEQGTTFNLYFPITRDDLTKKQDDMDMDAIKGNGESILIVDDEKLQRDIAGRMLTLLGYQTTCAASGEEAVRIIAEKPADLILLDMILELGMNGRQTYEKIIKTYPGQKAVIASGFSEDMEVKKTLELGAGALIKKPYSLAQLGNVVKQELGR